jgi:hypothetical protein
MENNNKYIYTNENSISKELCYDIIQMFESEENKNDGRTLGGVNKKVKDTVDYVINANDKKWYKYHQFLYKELSRNIKNYLDGLNKNNCINNNNQLSSLNYNYFDGKNLDIETFMVQRYIKNTGRYIYHNDFMVDIKNSKHRVITYLWYLNDVEEGGETVLEDNIFIKPTTGKLLLFPACWTYPHCGRIPISSNKYIITGWIYVSSN